MRQREMRGEET